MSKANKKHPNCEKCKLFAGCDSPFMQASGSDDPLVIVIGEAPGESEDRKGVPFVGRSGKLLRDVLKQVGFEEEDVLFTNTVRCRPPDNKITKKAINLCKEFMLEEIEYHDPELVLLMGNSPLNSVLGESGITTWNGIAIERDERIYVPLFHPAYILRNNAAMDDWLGGFLYAIDKLDDDDKKESAKWIFPNTVPEIVDMIEDLRQYEEIAWDVETHNLDPFLDDSAMIAGSLYGLGDNKAYAFPLEHPEAEWTDEELDEVIELVSDFLMEKSGKIIGHNLKYDQVWTARIFGIWFQAGGDTMLINHLLDSRQGIHSLKRLAGLHLDMYDYDRPLREWINNHQEANVYKGGSYATIPLKVLLPYAAMDAYATGNLKIVLFPQLSEKQKILYEQMILPVSDVFAEIEYNGITIDYYVASRYEQIYKIRRAEVLEELANDKNVKKMSKDVQKEKDDEVKERLSTKYSNGKTDKFGVKDTHISLNGRKLKRTLYKFNPNSSQQISKLLFEYYGMDASLVPKTTTGKPTTKYDELKRFEKKFPIIRKVAYFKLLTKMLGTYLTPCANKSWASGDDRVRTNYNLHGTRTGRPSSSNPNLMNIPTPEKEPGTLLAILPIKNMFKASSDDRILMSVDYSGMELRVFASLAKCEPMLEIHSSDVDFHTMVANMLSGIPYDDIDKATRYIYKWTNWTLLYGGSAYTLHKMYDIPLHDAENAVNKYYNRFPEVVDYLEETTDFAMGNGYIESPFGRREKLYYINDRNDINKGKANKDKRSAVNMPVQSAASDVLLLAMIVIRGEMEKVKPELKTLMVNTVYDSILFDVPKDEIDIVANLCVAIMENIKVYADEYFPDIDFDWLLSPLKADVEIGTHYGTIKSIDVMYDQKENIDE